VVERLEVPWGMDPAQLLATLRRATSFEEAADAVLQAMLAPTADFTRGVIHVRPGDSYSRLHASGGGAGQLQGATAWRWIAGHGVPVWVDIARASVHLHSQAGQPSAPAFQTERSALRFTTRGVTHVEVLPLRLAGGTPQGMVALEANLSIGQRAPLDDDTVAALLELADLAAPYLLALPPRKPAATPTDELLPVVGETLAPLIDMLRVFAQQDETIVLGGPTGTGKSRLARWCHAQSRRAAGPFTTLDLNTIPEELQLGELFGWKRGAFTGAVGDNPGALTQAARGTLFIDEIDKLSLKAQAGLLHVLEERNYRALGDARERWADARFIIGASVDLADAVRAGAFRPDLYYRIHVLPVRLPALAERRDEIVPWARYMLERRAREGGGGPGAVDPEAERVLTLAPWPGNLRQLDNIVRRAYTLALMSGGGTLLTRPVVERALSYERAGAQRAGLMHALRSAAEAFVEAALARGELDLELADALRGAVLQVASARVDDLGQAFTLLGKQALVRGRNHHKAFRREIERLHELAALLGAEESAQLAEWSPRPTE